MDEETELDPLKAAVPQGQAVVPLCYKSLRLSSLDPPSSTELLQPTMTTSTSLLDPPPPPATHHLLSSSFSMNMIAPPCHGYHRCCLHLRDSSIPIEWSFPTQ